MCVMGAWKSNRSKVFSLCNPAKYNREASWRPKRMVWSIENSVW